MEQSYSFLMNMINDGDTIVLGCSFGPDSMGAMSLLLRLRKEKNIFIICAHVNHNVRKASKQEEIDLKKYCDKNNVVFESMKIVNYGDDNFHNEARTIRYQFFKEMVQKYQAKFVITAHHGDDLMETVLMRIVRGSTLKGYCGFSQVVDYGTYKLLRPLIYVTKQEILQYDKLHKVPFAVDKSNFKDKYTRNRYRKYVLPFLKKEDKNVHEKFLKFSNVLFEASEYIDNEQKKLIKDVYQNEELDIDKMIKLPDIMINNIIFAILEKVYGDDLFLITDVHVSLIKSLFNSNKANEELYLPNDVKAIKSYNKLYIGRRVKMVPCYDIEIDKYAKLPNGKTITCIDSSDLSDNNYCRLNANDIVLPLHVRTRKNGDKMYIKGMNGHQKIKDIFIDKKIPLEQRDGWPIVVDSTNKVVWIPGIKKSKFDIPKDKKCDIILKYN